jgi:hypothetical protein
MPSIAGRIKATPNRSHCGATPTHTRADRTQQPRCPPPIPETRWPSTEYMRGASGMPHSCLSLMQYTPSSPTLTKVHNVRFRESASKRLRPPLNAQVIGTIPAHAGMVPISGTCRGTRSSAPRARGDDPSCQRSRRLEPMCSPTCGDGLNADGRVTAVHAPRHVRGWSLPGQAGAQADRTLRTWAG